MSEVLTDLEMTDWPMEELLGATRTISKEVASVSTEVQVMVLLAEKSHFASSAGAVMEMAMIQSLCQSWE